MWFITKVIKCLDLPMNCAELVFLITLRNTNSAQFIGESNDLITFGL